MNDNATKLLELLAQKLGTTTEYLWMVLVKQAPVDATITLFQTVLIMMFGWFLYRKHKRLMVKKDYNGYNETGYSHYEEVAYIPMIVGAIFFVIMSTVAFFCIQDIINGYFNPEYWALNKLLQTLSN